jgi:hypothetical protein
MAAHATFPTTARARRAPSRARRTPLRSGWLGSVVVRGLAMIAALVLARLVFGAAGEAVGLPSAVADVLTAGLLLATYVTVVRRVEHRTPAELARPGAVRDLRRGALLGAGLFGVTAAILWAAGSLTLTGDVTLSAVWPALAAAALAAVFEELMLRGVVFRLVEQRRGTTIALGFSAIVFGALHLLNPGASLTSAAAIALEAGVLLGAAYVLTRSLWLPIGLHFGWNATQSGIFGSPVSGVDAAGLFDTKLTGSQLLSGGTFGVEGSVVTVATCLVLAAVVLRMARARGHLVSRAAAGAAAPGAARA